MSLIVSKSLFCYAFLTVMVVSGIVQIGVSSGSSGRMFKKMTVKKISVEKDQSIVEE